MAKILKISMPVSERIYKAAAADIADGIKNAKSETDKAWWNKLQARVERRWKKFKGDDYEEKHVIRVGSSLKATPAPKPARSTKLAGKRIPKTTVRKDIEQGQAQHDEHTQAQ